MLSSLKKFFPLRTIVVALMASTIACVSTDDDMSNTLCDGPEAVLNVNCPEYDPCLLVDPPESEFQIKKIANLGQPVFDTLLSLTYRDGDTLSKGEIWFDTESDADSLLWNLSGVTDTWNVQSFNVQVPNSPGCLQMGISLTSRRIDYNDCLDPEERQANETKSIYLCEYNILDQIAFHGRYIGKHCSSQESLYTIEVKEGIFPFSTALEGFPRECAASQFNPRLVKLLIDQNRFVLMPEVGLTDQACGQPVGTGSFSSDGQEIEFTYRHANDDGTYDYRCWQGERIE